VGPSGQSHERPGARWRRGAIAIGLIIGALGIVASARAAGHTIAARNYEFAAPGGGSTLTIVAGDQVTWVASGDPHTVTSGAPGAIDDRFADRPAATGFLTAGDTFTTTFPTPGTYPYFCEVHFETMRGTVIVVAASTPTVTPTRAPASTPTPARTVAPTPRPTAAATPALTPRPTVAATSAPTVAPSAAATPALQPSGSEASPTPTSGPAGPASSDAPSGGLPVVLFALLGAAVAGGIVVAARRGRGGSG